MYTDSLNTKKTRDIHKIPFIPTIQQSKLTIIYIYEHYIPGFMHQLMEWTKSDEFVLTPVSSNLDLYLINVKPYCHLFLFLSSDRVKCLPLLCFYTAKLHKISWLLCTKLHLKLTTCTKSLFTNNWVYWIISISHFSRL